MDRVKCFLAEETEEWRALGENCQAQLFRDTRTGELKTLEELGPGAMWWDTDCHRMDDWADPTPVLCVTLPVAGHPRVWNIDGRANNCTRPDDKAHQCWCRHGEAPNITVDKNGNTCHAGAGSIMVPGWHGFLKNGWLEPCGR